MYEYMRYQKRRFPIHKSVVGIKEAVAAAGCMVADTTITPPPGLHLKLPLMLGCPWNILLTF